MSIPVAQPVVGNQSDGILAQANPVFVAEPPPPPYSPVAGVPGPAFAPMNERSACEFLTRHDWPLGLQNAFLRNLRNIPKRFIIVDDSGSMLANDGHRIVGNGTRKQIVSSTRWTELAESIKFHAQFAQAAHASTQFRLLNGSLPITVGESDDDDGVPCDTLVRHLEGSPSGGTPLCRHITQVIQEIRGMEAYLRASNKKVAVVIATDGESSDGDIAQAMAPLKNLPVVVVIRLCTDQDSICDYWNNIDKILELDLDILDDICAEGAEINAVNPWLTYAEPLHRMREFGVTLKEFDLLDETRLSGDQVAMIVRNIYGGEAKDYPHPDVDWKGFLRALDGVQSREKQVWNPVTRSASSWINRDALGRHLGKSGGCVIS